MKKPIVYVVHCVDTEGPLYESIEETFLRLKRYFGIDGIKPTKANLTKIQNAELDLNGLEKDAALVVSPEFLDYNHDYHKLDEMLAKLASPEISHKVKDSFGNGYLYNWHCVDHLDYDVNLRRKDIGMHNIFDHYKRFIAEYDRPDGIHWHFHPSNYQKTSHFGATSYLHDTKFFDILCRRIIERKWFPSVNRAGYHTERPDSHWLLEQYIPFDLSNQSLELRDEQPDVSGGRFGDWRRAPDDWSVYRPHHDDYQIPGNCRRYIARCLNIGTRFRCITQEEVRKAFEYAEIHGSCVLSYNDHDYRDMVNNVLTAMSMLENVSSEFPNVDFKYSEVREAMNLHLFDEYVIPENGLFTLTRLDSQSFSIEVEAREELFGPQPFLAFRTIDGRFYHQNFDFQESFRKWSYTFDNDSFNWNHIDSIGIGTNDKRGFPQVIVKTRDELIPNRTFQSQSAI